MKQSSKSFNYKVCLQQYALRYHNHNCNLDKHCEWLVSNMAGLVSVMTGFVSNKGECYGIGFQYIRQRTTDYIVRYISPLENVQIIINECTFSMNRCDGSICLTLHTLQTVSGKYMKMFFLHTFNFQKSYKFTSTYLQSKMLFTTQLQCWWQLVRPADKHWAQKHEAPPLSKSIQHFVKHTLSLLFKPVNVELFKTCHCC